MTQAKPKAPEPRGQKVGRFEMFDVIASGGFATIHLGRSAGSRDSSQLVAIKRPHPDFAKDPEIARLFLDEASVVGRIQHQNVVPVLDLVTQNGEVFLVMEYVEGLSLGHLIQELGLKKQRVPLDIVLHIMAGALHGLHAAHEATDKGGKPMGIVHRDVSPDNILVGVDGHARIIDFGVARALGRFRASHGGHVDGKPNYMSPEQVMGNEPVRQSDLFSAAVVLWRSLTGEQLFEGEQLAELAPKITQQPIDPPSAFVPGIPEKVDQVVLRGLQRDPSQRWATARDMAEAIETASTLASPGRVAKWVERVAAQRLARRADTRSAVEVTPSRKEPADGAEDDASTKGSTGENSFKAAVTQVVSLPSKSQKKDARPGVAEAAPDKSAPAKRVEVAAGAEKPPPSRRNLGASTASQPMMPAAVASTVSQPTMPAAVPAGASQPGSPPASHPQVAAQPSQPGITAPSPAVASSPSSPGFAVPFAPGVAEPSAPAAEPAAQATPAAVASGPQAAADIDVLLDEATPAPQSEAIVDVPSTPSGAPRSRKALWAVVAVVTVGAVVLAVAFSSGPGGATGEDGEPQAAAEPETPSEPAVTAAESEPTIDLDDSSTTTASDEEVAADDAPDAEDSAAATATPVAAKAKPVAVKAPPSRPAVPRPPPRRPPPPPKKPAEEDLFGRE